MVQVPLVTSGPPAVYFCKQSFIKEKPSSLLYIPCMAIFRLQWRSWIFTVSVGFYFWKRHHDYGNSYKRKHLIGDSLCFRGLVHYYGRKHGGKQGDMVLDRLWEFYIHISRHQEERVTLALAWASETSKCSPSNMLIPSATNSVPSCEPVGTIFIHTITLAKESTDTQNLN